MTLNKKGLRKIEIEGNIYEWMIRKKAGNQIIPLKHLNMNLL